VQNSSRVGLQGFVVVFDHSATLKATSDSKGNVTIVVPPASITGHDTLSIYDPSGTLANVVSISPSASSSTYTAPPLVVGPPPPPASV
jgi:hypothetical protein